VCSISKYRKKHKRKPGFGLNPAEWDISAALPLRDGLGQPLSSSPGQVWVRSLHTAAKLRNTFLGMFNCKANTMMLSKSSAIGFRAGDQGAEKLSAGCERKVVTVPGANPKQHRAA